MGGLHERLERARTRAATVHRRSRVVRVRAALTLAESQAALLHSQVRRMLAAAAVAPGPLRSLTPPRT